MLGMYQPFVKIRLGGRLVVPGHAKHEPQMCNCTSGNLEILRCAIAHRSSHCVRPGMTLRAHVSYAVCDKLCIPVEAQAELAFASVASTEDGNLSDALNTVPKPANIGDPNPLTIRDVKRDGKNNVLVDVIAPESKEVSLFVEGPTPDWALPVPKLVEQSPPGVKRFTFELDGLPPGASAEGAALRLTLVGGDRAYEFNVSLN